MSDNEIFEIDEDDAKVFIPKTKNKANKNKKNSMTPERKEALLEQLARGRATSALNRAKASKAKKIKKQDQVTEQDEMIYKDIEKKKKKNTPLKMIVEEDEIKPVELKFNKKTKRIEDDEDLFSHDKESTDDEQLEEQIKKLQSRKKKKPVAVVSEKPVTEKPVAPVAPVAPVTYVDLKTLKPWEMVHLWAK